jgi:hypothetical protein
MRIYGAGSNWFVMESDGDVGGGESGDVSGLAEETDGGEQGTGC